MSGLRNFTNWLRSIAVLAFLGSAVAFSGRVVRWNAPSLLTTSPGFCGNLIPGRRI